MPDLLLLALAFAGGHAACVGSWPSIKIYLTGLSGEVAHPPAKAQQLENRIRGR